MKRAPVLILSLLFATLTGLLPGLAGAQPKEVVIGVVYPMSGPNAQAGTDDKPVFEIAADIANGAVDIPFPFYQKLRAMPGLKGAKVRLIFSDHQAKPEIGQGEVERLITQEKVHAVVCCWNSNVTATASRVAERHGIPMVNAESSSPALTEQGLKWFFRTSPHDGHFSQAMFDFFRDFQAKRGIKLRTLGLTYEDTTFGADSGKVQKELAGWPRAAAGAARPRRLTHGRSRPPRGAAGPVCAPARGDGSGPHLSALLMPLPDRTAPRYSLAAGARGGPGARAGDGRGGATGPRNVPSASYVPFTAPGSNLA